jgi:hypothetical protein
MVVGDQRARGERALRCILDQDPEGRAEIIVADLAETHREPLPCYAHPSVRVLRLPDGSTFGDARSAAGLAATAPIVAYIEEHCVAEDGWLDAVIAAFESDTWDAIGYEISNGNPGEGVSDSIFLLSYARWAPPARAGATSLLPAMNVAFRREVLLEFRDKLPGLMVFETALYAALVASGRRLGIVPTARIRHLNESSLATALEANLLCHRVMAHSRAELLEWSAAKRWVHILSAPLVPWYRLARMTTAISLFRPRQLGAWIRSLPVFMACAYAAAFGKVAGLAAGPGTAPARFTRLELDAPRSREDLFRA